MLPTDSDAATALEMDWDDIGGLYICKVTSEFNAWNLNVPTLGGAPGQVIEDIKEDVLVQG